MGRTVENTLTHQTQRKESQRAHSTPAFRWKCRTVEKFKTKHKKGITKEQHITKPCFIGGNWTVEKYSKTKHKERNHKEQHITQLLLYR
jgi:hypothetical protein